MRAQTQGLVHLISRSHAANKFYTEINRTIVQIGLLFSFHSLRKVNMKSSGCLTLFHVGNAHAIFYLDSEQEDAQAEVLQPTLPMCGAV